MVLKICKYLSFGFVALLTVYMAVASVLEKLVLCMYISGL